MPRHIVGCCLMALCLLLFGITILGSFLSLIPMYYGAWLAIFTIAGGYFGATLMTDN